MGSVDFGAIACREMVPDLWDIASGFTDAVEELRRLAEERESTPPSSPKPAAAKKAAAKKAAPRKVAAK
jgi:hypothetical protein